MATASPGHACGPTPNVNVRRDGRRGSKVAGSGFAFGSRLAAARITSTTSPAFIAWPATVASRPTKRRVFWTGESYRATSRTTDASSLSPAGLASLGR